MKIVNGVQIVSIEINPQHWSVIQAGLHELPFKIAQPILADLQRQVVEQSRGNPPAPIEPNDTLEVATPVT